VLLFLSCKVEIDRKRRNSHPAFAKVQSEIEESELANRTSKESLPTSKTIEESRQHFRPFGHTNREFSRFQSKANRSAGVSVFRTKGE